MLRQNRTVVDLDAIRHNYRILADYLPAGIRVMPVVKADAYGHGMLEVAKAVLSEGADFFGVVLAEEGIELRCGGVAADILVMGVTMERAMDEAVRYGLTLTVFDPATVAPLNDIAKKQGRIAPVHVKLDTGMGRIGLRTMEEAKALRETIHKASHVKVTGIYTHFADADRPAADGRPNRFTQGQLQRFRALKDCFDPDIPAHAANSAFSLLAPNDCFQMVRAGIALYGYPPVTTDLPFRPALRWESEIVYVKDIAEGTPIGYGCTFTAPRAMRVATVAVGYGDGYHRAISNRGQMLVRGQRAAVIGRVCMDQTMIDVTHIPEVRAGDQAVLLGKQGQEEIYAGQLAEWAGTISHEVLLAVTRRVPRIYKYQG